MYLIAKIDAFRQLFQSLNPKPEIKEKLQRVSLLKSSLYSARIEGNPLTEPSLLQSTDYLRKKEVDNILHATKFIAEVLSDGKSITKQSFLSLHKIVMRDLTNEVGFFRKDMGAIFNETGVAVYLPPPPSKINPLIGQLVSFINSDQEKFPIITALISHLIFEKIHPFIDGNGRVGRLLIPLVLRLKKYDFGLCVPVEEYFDNHKADYYYALDIGLKNTSDYLLFMLTAYTKTLDDVKIELHNAIKESDKIYLPPRQEEIWSIIKEHRTVSFDFLRRRFLRIPKRTLRYDIQQLVKQDLIVKIGKTKGSYYTVK